MSAYYMNSPMKCNVAFYLNQSRPCELALIISKNRVVNKGLFTACEWFPNRSHRDRWNRQQVMWPDCNSRRHNKRSVPAVGPDSLARTCCSQVRLRKSSISYRVRCFCPLIKHWYKIVHSHWWLDNPKRRQTAKKSHFFPYSLIIRFRSL